MFIEGLFTTAKIWKQPKCPWLEGDLREVKMATQAFGGMWWDLEL